MLMYLWPKEFKIEKQIGLLLQTLRYVNFDDMSAVRQLSGRSYYLNPFLENAQTSIAQSALSFQTSTLKDLSERSPAVGDFFGTRIEIWAGFEPVRQLLRLVFSCFHGQIFFFKTFQTVKTFLAQNETKKYIFFFLKSLKKNQAQTHFQLCLALLETPHRGTSL